MDLSTIPDAVRRINEVVLNLRRIATFNRKPIDAENIAALAHEAGVTLLGRTADGIYILSIPPFPDDAPSESPFGEAPKALVFALEDNPAFDPAKTPSYHALLVTPEDDFTDELQSTIRSWRSGDAADTISDDAASSDESSDFSARADGGSSRTDDEGEHARRHEGRPERSGTGGNLGEIGRGGGEVDGEAGRAGSLESHVGRDGDGFFTRHLKSGGVNEGEGSETTLGSDYAGSSSARATGGAGGLVDGTAEGGTSTTSFAATTHADGDDADATGRNHISEGGVVEGNRPFANGGEEPGPSESHGFGSSQSADRGDDDLVDRDAANDGVRTRGIDAITEIAVGLSVSADASGGRQREGLRSDSGRSPAHNDGRSDLHRSGGVNRAADPALAAEIGFSRVELDRLRQQQDALLREIECQASERAAGEILLAALRTQIREARAEQEAVRITLEQDVQAAQQQRDDMHHAAVRVRDSAAHALGLLEILPNYFVKASEIEAVGVRNEDGCVFISLKGMGTANLLYLDKKLYPNLAIFFNALLAITNPALATFASTGDGPSSS